MQCIGDAAWSQRKARSARTHALSLVATERKRKLFESSSTVSYSFAASEEMILSAVALSAPALTSSTGSRGGSKKVFRGSGASSAFANMNNDRLSSSSSSSSSPTCSSFPARRRHSAAPRAGNIALTLSSRTVLSTAALSTASPSHLSSTRSFTRRRHAVVVNAAGDNKNDNNEPVSPTFGLAPMDPRSPHGEMLAHVLSAEPHLFTAAVEATLDRMSDDLDKEEQTELSSVVDASTNDSSNNPSSASIDNDGAGLVLFKRIKEMRALERRNAVQDLMYADIIQKFLNVGVDMLPPLDEEPFYVRGVDLNKLTDAVHSTEALSMVKEHLLGMLGPEASAAYSNSLVRMSKLQAAQMYAASIMFGYFLRKADKRFSLERAAGTLPMNPTESAEALERLFNSASAMDSMDEADMFYDVDKEGNASASQQEDAAGAGAGGSATLKQYIQSFDQETLAETARIVSMEGVVLAERQTGALFGSLEELAQEMQSALQEGDEVEPITTPEQLMSRVQEVVGEGKVKTVTVNVATQRRVVLEAVAFGSFLRDAETMVDGHDGRLLTPASTGGGQDEPPGMISA